jgi:menaquinone-9 beta-reductase
MKPITIIGGGLAGLTLGIALRERDVPVSIIEAGRYPRHRVCGEFISGSGAEVVQAMDLVQPLRAESVAFFSGARNAGYHRLPVPALCVSRFVLDAALAKMFREMGGELREGERWHGCNHPGGVVLANGRRPSAVEDGFRWFGLKVHARKISLDADLEMHLSENSYVGLCRLPDDEVNVCGLFRRAVSGDAHGKSLDWLRGEPGSQLFERLTGADFVDDSFCAVAGLNLSPQPIDVRECRIGDALTMIPPITGNGMSMAFESAQLATAPLSGYARGENSWEEATAEIARSSKTTFARRLNWAIRLHRVMFSEAGATALRWMFRATPLWRASFALTR